MPPHDFTIQPALGRIDGVVAGYSSRLGGVSSDPFASLNLGGRTGDDRRSVDENRQRFFQAFGIRSDQLALAEQVHGNLVAAVEAPGEYAGVDGLVTRTPGLALAIAAADCAAILLADPKAGVVGACHAGWRGTASNVVRTTIDAMSEAGAASEHVHAFVGPCISREQFEVGDEVAAQFEPRFVTRNPAMPRPHVDLRAALKDQLLTNGVREENIEISPFCTYERTDLFFSYRAEAGITGRMMGFVMLSDAQRSGLRR